MYICVHTLYIYIYISPVASFPALWSPAVWSPDTVEFRALSRRRKRGPGTNLCFFEVF